MARCWKAVGSKVLKPISITVFFRTNTEVPKPVGQLIFNSILTIMTFIIKIAY